MGRFGINYSIDGGAMMPFENFANYSFQENPLLTRFSVDPNLALNVPMSTQPTSWLSRMDSLTPGQIGGMAAMLGSVGKTMMHPGNPMQGAADAAIKYGPGMAQKEMINSLISALKDSKPAGTTLSATSGGGVNPSTPTTPLQQDLSSINQGSSLFQFLNPNFILK